MANLIECLFYIMLVVGAFGILGCVLWFAEETKIGIRLFDKLYDYFMKN